MKILIISGLLVFVCLFFIKPIESLAIPSDQNIVVTKSWNLPMPNNQNDRTAITSSFSGNEIYFIESNSNTIGRLVPETNTITEWTIQSNTSSLDSIALGFTGSDEIYFADSNSNTIGRLAPTTNLVTQWDVPTPNSHPTSIKFDRTTGNVYFIESNSNTIGRLAPFSSEFTEWKLQEKPVALEVDSAGNVHYINENGTKIVRMD